MDPITGAVVALVFWLVIAWVGWVVLYMGSVFIGAGIADEEGAVGGAIVGWLLGAGWWIFAIIHFVLQIVNLVQLLGAGG